MKIIVPRHTYVAEDFEGGTGQTVQFIHKEKDPENPETLKTVQDGTTNEELLRILIDRTKGLNEMFPCRENSIAITKMEEALMWFEKRTKDRKERGVEGKHKP